VSCVHLNSQLHEKPAPRRAARVIYRNPGALSRKKEAGVRRVCVDYLGRELFWFEGHRQRLFELFPGKWIAVHNQKPLGVFATLAEAYEFAVETACSEKILVKQILEKDKVLFLGGYNVLPWYCYPEEPPPISVRFCCAVPAEKPCE
jgi:hypothetical protein